MSKKSGNIIESNNIESNTAENESNTSESTAGTERVNGVAVPERVESNDALRLATKRAASKLGRVANAVTGESARFAAATAAVASIAAAMLDGARAAFADEWGSNPECGERVIYDPTRTDGRPVAVWTADGLFGVSRKALRQGKIEAGSPAGRRLLEKLATDPTGFRVDYDAEKAAMAMRAERVAVRREAEGTAQLRATVAELLGIPASALSGADATVLRAMIARGANGAEPTTEAPKA